LSVEGTEQVLRAGGALVVPRGTRHALIVTSQTARIVLPFTPASAVTKDFFRHASEPAAEPTLTPPAPNAERSHAAAERSGPNVIGLPPFPRATPTMVRTREI
jgi:hypothetical protein